jgi:predicted DNA-binding transcriptional regulator AlpA
MSSNKHNEDDVMSEEYLTLQGLAKMLAITKPTLYKIIRNEELGFPKPFPLMNTQQRKKNLWSKKEVREWLESQRDQKVT